jgi:hypothetical protein
MVGDETLHFEVFIGHFRRHIGKRQHWRLIACGVKNTDEQTRDIIDLGPCAGFEICHHLVHQIGVGAAEIENKIYRFAHLALSSHYFLAVSLGVSLATEKNCASILSDFIAQWLGKYRELANIRALA